MFTFESPGANPALLDITGTATVEDPNGLTPPATIIQLNDAWRVRVNWVLSGGFAPLLNGDFHVNVYAESIGSAFEGQLGTQQDVPVVGAGAYTAVVDVPAAPASTLTPGAYRLVTLITHTDLAANPTEIAAFEEGQIVQLYQQP
ncbi:hypothetical protein [Promineifilum sp.]|uniref:hypothetical protein n=1 Tax=Promineifilum sp. TaxID=2664178 RepID=UPI0035B06392